MSLVEFIQDNRWWVLVVCLPLLVIYGRVLFLAALGAGPETKKTTRPPTMPLRKLPPKPGSQIKAPSNSNIKSPLPPVEGRQEVLPGSLGAGVSGHQKAGSAKTVKLPVATPKPTDLPSPPVDEKDIAAEEMDGLFGPRDDDVPTETQSAAIRRKASRLQELGFHHSIESDAINAVIAAKAEKRLETPTPTADPDTEFKITKNIEPKSIPADAPVAPISTLDAPTGAPEPPRSSTAELTSILERIDKFLAEDTPSKPAPVIEDNASAKTDTPAQSSTSPSANEPIPTETKIDPPVAAPAKPATEAGAKPKPMWARSDVTDDDLSAPDDADKSTRSPDDKKTDGGQQKLF